MASNKKKGSLVEDIVALLHENQQGVKVDKRVRLPSLVHGNSRKREIDVLLSVDVVGYPTRFAVECKNERKRVGTGRIDEFIGKLQDVGIPLSHGIFVSPTGFTSTGLARARSVGIRPLLLEGLNSDRLAIELSQALQSEVYLVASWSQISRIDDVEEDADSTGPFIRTILPGNLGFGTPAILTHLWLLWVNEKIPPLIGTYHIYTRLPDEFYFEGDKEVFRKGVAIATLEVVGQVAIFQGQAKRLGLRHAETSQLEKLRIDANFEEPPDSIQLVLFGTEQDLEGFMNSHAVALQHRVRVPRLVSERTYWPPTQGALRKIQELKAKGEEITFEKVEGKSLSRAWEFVVGEDGEDEGA